MANGGARPGESYYPKAGIAYGKRTDSMYGYIKPCGQVFSQEGQAIFPQPDISIWGALALANSSIYSRHANYVAGQHKYHNYLNKICLPTAAIPRESSNAKEAYEVLRAMDQANENTHLFVSPQCRSEFAFGRSNHERTEVAEKLLCLVNGIRTAIDKELHDALQLQGDEAENRKVDYYSHYFGESFSPHLEHSSGW